jgi:hypothetical protein
MTAAGHAQREQLRAQWCAFINAAEAIDRTD